MMDQGLIDTIKMCKDDLKMLNKALAQAKMDNAPFEDIAILKAQIKRTKIVLDGHLNPNQFITPVAY